MTRKPFDLIVYGATGFTGRLVAEYLLRTYGVGGEVAWAMAARSQSKLQQVRDLIGAPANLPLLVADAAQPRAVAELAQQTKVMLTTVGPYQLYGEPLVEACAQAGTDYVDLCGEPAWMAKMIGRLQALAAASGARIVFSCGFDSIPFDLGVMYLQAQAQGRFGMPLQRVQARVRRMKGGLSGGTAASAMATFADMAKDPSVAAAMANPFALTPGFSGPAQPDGERAQYDDWAKAWSGPFVMASINTKNVHRTNALRGHPWGQGFLYDERLSTGAGPAGASKARWLARGTRVQNALLGFGPTRALIGRFAVPQPGQGPTAMQREKGLYELWFYGQTTDGRTCVRW